MQAPQAPPANPGSQDPRESPARAEQRKAIPGGHRVERGVVFDRKPLIQRLNAWRKRSAFNPYWLDRRVLRDAVTSVASRASGWLLDVGVAERPYEADFAPFVERYIGLEYPVVVNNLNPDVWNYPERIRGIVDIWGDGNHLPFADASFDTVLTVEVLEHVPDPFHMMGEMARVLKPGGAMLLTVPFAAELHQLPYDYWRYTPNGIRELVEQHGLVVERIEPRGNMAIALGSLLSNWLLRSFASRGKQHDGSTSLSRWRAPLVLPLIALVQVFFLAASKVTKDSSLAVGHWAVARKPR